LFKLFIKLLKEFDLCKYSFYVRVKKYLRRQKYTVFLKDFERFLEKSAVFQIKSLLLPTKMKVLWKKF